VNLYNVETSVFLLFFCYLECSGGHEIAAKVITLTDPGGTIVRVRIMKNVKKVRMKIRWSTKRMARRK
jgi:hypothetical protein